MNCEIFAQMLDNYADLTDEEIQELESHAIICQSCNDDLAFMRSILGTVKSLPPIDPPSDFLESVNIRLDKELARESVIKRFVRRSRPYVYRYGAIAACAVLAVGVSMNADMLLARMNNDNSGIIAEESITDVSDPSDDVVGETEYGYVTAEPEESDSTPLPAVVTNRDVKQTDLPLQTPKPVLSASPSSSDSVSYRSKEASSNTTTAVVPSDNTSAAENKNLPVTSPAPQPLEKTKVNSSPVHEADEQPAPKALAEDNANTKEPEVEPIAGKIAGRIVSRAAEPDPYAIDEVAVSIPYGYSVLTATEEPESENYDAQDYSIAYDEMNNQASDVTSYAPLSSMVSIKSKDAARVQELVDVFVSGVYGNYYMITAVDMRNLLGQFDREGIWYSASIMESGDGVSFRLVIVPSD